MAVTLDGKLLAFAAAQRVNRAGQNSDYGYMGDHSNAMFRPVGLLASELANTDVSHESLQSFDTSLNILAPGLFRAVRDAQPDVILCMGRVANCYGGVIQRRFPNIAVVGTVRTGK